MWNIILFFKELPTKTNWKIPKEIQEPKIIHRQMRKNQKTMLMCQAHLIAVDLDYLDAVDWIML